MSRAEFFDTIRPMFGGQLTQAQVDGLDLLLSVISAEPVEHQAYLLATTYHETAQTMQPITEYGGRTYFNKYDTGKLAAALGNTPEADGDGFLYRGRGYVQITGRSNYARAGKALDVDLIGNPDLALHPTIAARILVLGCTQGWFTGKKLADYLPGDYVNARRVVNGTDRADLIASYARTFEMALRSMGPTIAPAPPAQPPKPQPAPSQPATRESPWAWLRRALAGLFGK